MRCDRIPPSRSSSPTSTIPARAGGRSRTPSRRRCRRRSSRPRCTRASAPGERAPSRTGCWPRFATSSVAMPYADDPFALTIFGASGDLTRRKLIPALWSLYATRTLPEPFTILGTARTELHDEAFRAQMREAVAAFARVKIPSPVVWDRFAQSLFYVAGDPTAPDLYARLRQRLEELERARARPSNRIFYYATPPSLYDDITAHL